jgi:hypothetical protein
MKNISRTLLTVLAIGLVSSALFSQQAQATAIQGATVTGTATPDGGATVALLGIALIGRPAQQAAWRYGKEAHGRT